MNWTDDFIARCLEGVPHGDYRDRTEQELRDHLLSLIQDLKEAGHSLDESLSLAQVRMGNPTELAQRYVQEWKRRRRTRLLPCALMAGCALLNMWVALFYAFNFGAPFVRAFSGTWPFVYAAYLFPALWKGKWEKIRYYSQCLAEVNAITALFWLPVPDFHLIGVSIPWGFGMGFHLLIVGLCLTIHTMIKEIEHKETAVKLLNESGGTV